MPDEPTPHTLKCIKCATVFDSGLSSSGDAIFTMTGTLECPACGELNDLAQVKMRSLDYESLVRWLLQGGLIAEQEDTPAAIKPPVAAFIANWNNVVFLTIFPAAVVFAEKLSQYVCDIAAVRKSGRLGPPFPPETISEADLRALTTEFANNGVALSSMTNIGDAARGIDYQPQSEVKARYGLSALFASSLVSTWTAFETLAGDLWEATVNARPGLAGHVATSIKTEMLQKHGFNVPHQMGTILREMKAVSFTVLDEIRNAYKSTFTKHAQKIDASLANKSLDALSQARNLIVHKAGKCDAEYISRAKGLPQLPHLALGEQLMTNGILARQLIEPVITCCQELIDSVGAWLRSHPA